MIPGSVHVAYIHGDDVAAPFHTCMTKLLMFDLSHKQRIMHGGITPSWCGSSVIPQGRNTTTRAFLMSDAEWLFQIDADMAFRHDIVEQLVEVAEAADLKVLGGLAFAWKIDDVNTDYGTPIARIEPTIYAMSSDGAGLIAMDDVPDSTLIQVGATGGAVLLIHRSVMEALRDKHGETWWSQIPHPLPDKPDNMIAEDMSFCIRATAAGFPVYVHTGIETKHAKHTYLDLDLYRRSRVVEPVPTFAVIPVKDRWEMTSALLRQLEGQCDGVFVYDNGSTPETRARLREQSIADVFPAEGLTIGEMWNAGVAEAASRVGSSRFNVAFLNNDIVLSDDCLPTLATELRKRQRIAAACPAWHREHATTSEVTPLRSIAAGGKNPNGLCGWCFMVKGEVFEHFEFPAAWWYTDNAITMWLDATSGEYVMVPSCSVEHLDGGSQTIGDADTYAASPQHTADRAEFERWCKAVFGEQAA